MRHKQNIDNHLPIEEWRETENNIFYFLLSLFQILFIFTPPLTGFLAKRCCSFRIMLSILTALGGFQALGLLAIPPGRDTTPYPKTLNWGISCGRPNNRARFQKVRQRALEP